MIVRAAKAIWRAMGFHVHQWTPWRHRGELVRCADPIAEVAEVQMRQCETCGRKQTKRIWY